MSPADESTLDSTKTSSHPQLARFVGLSIACHPDLRRVGQVACLFDEGGRGQVRLSRNEPAFRHGFDDLPVPLASVRSSRVPVLLELEARQSLALTLTPQTGAELSVDGSPITGRHILGREELERGVLLGLGRYILLRLAVFHAGVLEPDLASSLKGRTPAICELRAEIARVAQLDVPVLLRGETGVGKELVAEALHRGSRRSNGPYACVNMAAIPPSMAAAELFGYVRGAFTGAGTSRAGYFADADGGSLFLDEIGNAALDVQSTLLRAIETGVIQPLGAAPKPVSVRLITATDSDLESAVDRGQFSGALLRRFGYELWITPLRERTADIPELFVHFLAEESRSLGDSSPRPGGERALDESPYLSSELVMQLIRYAWPGNVRELRNVARRYAIYNRDRDRPRLDERLSRLLDPTPELRRSEHRVAPKRETRQPSEAEIVDALRRHDFEIESATRELGVSRSWLHARINQLPSIRKAKDLAPDEIKEALAQTGGDMATAAAQLRVSVQGLRLQMTRFGIARELK